MIHRVSWPKRTRGMSLWLGGRISWSCEQPLGTGCVVAVVVAVVGSSRLGDEAATYSSMRKGDCLHATKQVCGHSARRR